MTPAALLGISPDDLHIIDIRNGSVHVFIRMPTQAAYKLKTAALNRNVGLVKSGIHALRLTTDHNLC